MAQLLNRLLERVGYDGTTGRVTLNFRPAAGMDSDAAARDYMDVHLPRLVRTMTLVPKPAGVRRALELGSYMQMAPALHALCGYPEVCGADFGQLSRRAVGIGIASKP